MDVAVTGATGLLGRAVTDALLARGHRVRALVRRLDAPLPSEVTRVSFASDAPLDDDALTGVHAVLHLAGEPVSQRWTDGVRTRIRASRVEGTARIAEAAARAGVGAVVSASAIGYYGARHDAVPLDEDAAPGSDFLARVCVAWEAALAPARAAGLRVVALRIGVVLDPGSGALGTLLPVFRRGGGAVVGAGTQVLSWIHRDDAVAMCVTALEDARWAGPVNVTAPEPVSNRQFAHTLGHVLHRPVLLHVPGFVLRAAYGEMASVVLTGQRVVPARATALGFAWRFPALGPALADLVGAHRGETSAATGR